MPRLGIDKLGLPAPDHDPVLAPNRTDGSPCFESAADARREDQKRVKLLRRQLRKRSPLVDRRQAEALLGKLAGKRPPSSLGSARHLHRKRRRMIGALWKLVRDAD